MKPIFEFRHLPDVLVVRKTCGAASDTRIWKTWDAFAQEHAALATGAHGFPEEKLLKAVLQDTEVAHIRLRYRVRASELYNLGPQRSCFGESAGGDQQIIITLRQAAPASITAYAPLDMGLGQALARVLQRAAVSTASDRPNARDVLLNACRLLRPCESKEDCESVLLSVKPQVDALELEDRNSAQDALDKVWQDFNDWHNAQYTSRVQVAARLQLGELVRSAASTKHAERMSLGFVLAAFLIIATAAVVFHR